MTNHIIALVKKLYPAWKTDERMAALGRQLGRYDDEELEPIIQDDFDNPDRPFGFDARRIAATVRANRKKRIDNEWDRLTPRQQMARIIRRESRKRFPAVMEWDDDRVLRDRDATLAQRQIEVNGRYVRFWSYDQGCIVCWDPHEGCARPAPKSEARERAEARR